MAMQTRDGQRAGNASRITRWIQMLEALYHGVNITQQGRSQPGRSPSSQQLAGHDRIRCVSAGESSHNSHEIASPKPTKCKWKSIARSIAVTPSFGDWGPERQPFSGGQWPILWTQHHSPFGDKRGILITRLFGHLGVDFGPETKHPLTKDIRVE
jgi:hypothetical protein